MKLGIIGTNWITGQFVEAAHATGAYRLTAVYSRKMASGEAFAAKYAEEATVLTDLPAFFGSDIDVVYIASPNSLHVAQTLAAIEAGKHVIVEKPMVTTPSQLAQLEDALAAHPDVMIFEAARHLYDPNFAVVKDYLASHQPTGAMLTYAKYSSRYDDYLAGKNPNVFNPAFAGGALMDLGVYLVYAAVAWFGMPKHASYLPHLLANGIDGDGVMQLEYGDFAVTLRAGKTTNSHLPSEVYFGRTTLSMDTPGELKFVRELSPEGANELTQPQVANKMIPEAQFFADAIMTNDRAAFERQWQLAKHVHTLIGTLVESADLHLSPNDN